MEERGLKIIRKKTEYLVLRTSRRRDPFTGRDSKESEHMDAEVTRTVQSGWKNWKSLECCATEKCK